MNKPKLLVVADTYYPKVDGTLRFIEEFLKRAGQNFEISLLVPKLKGSKTTKYETTFITPSSVFSLSGYPNMKLSFSNLRKIKQEVKKVDCVFVQGPALISYLSVIYARRAKKKVVFYTHVLSWEVFAKFMPVFIRSVFFAVVKKLSIYVYNRCDEILVPYQGLLQELKKAGVRRSIQVAKLGIDITKFAPTAHKSEFKQALGISAEKIVVGYVGRISKEKNVEVLVRAFTMLDRQEDLVLLLVGAGLAIGSETVPTNCKVTGFVSNVEKYLKAMDIFVMPSLTETTSLATLEAMASSLPVIVSKVGFLQEYVVKDHNGLFFAKNSAQMLSMKIEKLRNDKKLMQRLGTQARKTVAYSFSWERSINKIKKLLLKLILQ